MPPVGFEPKISAGELPRPLFAPGKDPVPILQEAGWVPGPVWTGAENLVDIRVLDNIISS